MKRIVGLAIIYLFATLAACSVTLEPEYNERIVAEVESLTADTQLLFASIAHGIPATGYEERKITYIALAAKAATIKLYAEARPAPSGKVPSFFRNWFGAATPASVAPSSGDRDAALDTEERYANATGDFMVDYLRNLEKLAKRDRNNV